jgi:hypothetical protein
MKEHCRQQYIRLLLLADNFRVLTVVAVLYKANMGPAAVCVVFEVPDEDEAQPAEMKAQIE